MSSGQTDRNPDIQKLLDEGYSVSFERGCIVIKDVPYLDSEGNSMEDGMLVGAYPHSDHTFHFNVVPYRTDGKTLHVAGTPKEWNGFTVSAHLSLKKIVDGSQADYTDYHDKVTHYIEVLSAHAKSKNPDLNARRYRPIDTSKEEDNPFNYEDSNSSRAGIRHISEKLEGHKVAIVGVGGTGAYVLDFLAKTPVHEIHIYDGDMFHTHNAFRVPGAVSKERLDNPVKKVIYFHELYSPLRKRIVPHDYPMTAAIVSTELKDFDFVFVCMDPTEDKRDIVLRLLEEKISFVDCGIGIEDTEGSLWGTLRVTTIMPESTDGMKHIPLQTNTADIYGSNIQIAEINALTAALAVVRWKKVVGFYHDHRGEHHSTYMVNANTLTNDETEA